MGAVLSLDEARADRTPHLEGAARCISCQHEWHAVAPVGTHVLECPACSLPKGRFVHKLKRGEQTWTCNCGCELFSIAPQIGPYCINCGAEQDGGF